MSRGINLEAEKDFLSILLNNPGCIVENSEKIRPALFYDPFHNRLADIIRNNILQSMPIEISTLGKTEEDQLRIKAIKDRNISFEHIDSFFSVLESCFVYRELEKAAHETVSKLQDENREPTDILGDLNMFVETINQKRSTSIFHAESFMDKIVDGYVENRRKFLSGEEVKKENIIETTIPGLNGLLINGGFHGPEFVVIAATPSVGKTEFALQLARESAVRQGKTVFVYSLEMKKEQLMERLLVAESGVPAMLLNKGQINELELASLQAAAARLKKSQLLFEENLSADIFDIISSVRRANNAHGLDLVIIDYLQLIKVSATKDGNRVAELSTITRLIKQECVKLNIPFVVLSQLSRAHLHEQREPDLRDLRDSGCVTGDTRILRADTGEEVTIKEISDSEEKDIPVVSLGSDYKLGTSIMKKAFPSGNKRVYALTLKSGLQIKASANHPFKTLFGWSRLDELEPGSRIAVPRRLHNPEKEADIDDRYLILLGHMLGDGCMLKRHALQYTSGDIENINTVNEAASVFGITGVIKKCRTYYDLFLPSPYRVTHSRRNPMVLWLDTVGAYNKRAHEKVVPSFVFGLSAEKKRVFLRHLWATDGSITIKNDVLTIYYSSTSRPLIDGVRLLLLAVGIKSRVKENRKKGYRVCYNLYVTGHDDKTAFLSAIGSNGVRGDCTKDALLYLETKVSNTNVDTIPMEVWSHVKDRLYDIKMTRRELADELGECYAGSYQMGRCSRRERVEAIGNVVNDPLLVNIATSDVFWDEVKSITDMGKEDVYDAEVYETHNFIANGIIVHNSIEQDTDTVAFLHATSKEKKKMLIATKMILGKQRNGPIGDIYLENVKGIQTFREITESVYKQRIGGKQQSAPDDGAPEDESLPF